MESSKRSSRAPVRACSGSPPKWMNHHNCPLVGSLLAKRWITSLRAPVGNGSCVWRGTMPAASGVVQLREPFLLRQVSSRACVS